MWDARNARGLFTIVLCREAIIPEQKIMSYREDRMSSFKQIKLTCAKSKELDDDVIGLLRLGS